MDCEQESERSTHGVDHELERGIIPVGAPPLVDEEVHRHKTDFPEDEEDQQVERHEDTEHACLEEEEQHHVRLDAVSDAERGKDGKRREQRGQQDHRQREDRPRRGAGTNQWPRTRRRIPGTGSRSCQD